MPFTGDDHNLPAGTIIPNGTASDAVTQHNAPLTDISDALSELAVRVTGKQPLDTDLTAIAALTSAANKMPYATGAGTWALADLTAVGRAILDDASADAQLVTLGGGTAGIAAFKSAAVADIRNQLDATPYVVTRTVLKALDTTKDTVAQLTENGRSGLFVWRSGDYSALITLDAQEGLYIKADAIASSAGAWVRQRDNLDVHASWFGAVGDGVTDDKDKIQAALDVAGFNGRVWLLSNTTYAVAGLLDIFKGQLLTAPVASGDIFGGVPIYGTTLLYTGTAGNEFVRFGADPAGTVGTLQTFGGGLHNLQIDGDYKAIKVLRLAACGVASFENLKLMRPQDTASGHALACIANATLSGLDNTIRNCMFKNITLFAYGAANGLYNAGNGTEGGLTGCVFDDVFIGFGYGAGAGNGAYFSSMDSCSFYGFKSYRADSAATGIELYLDGDAVSGKNVQSNQFFQTRISRNNGAGGSKGGTVYATGKYSNGNYIHGINEVDHTVATVVLRANGGDVYYTTQSMNYGLTPNEQVMPTGKHTRLDVSNNAASVLLTLSHELHVDASAPAIGIGAGIAFDVLTAAANIERIGQIDAVTTSVTGAAEASKLVFRVMNGGAQTSPMELNAGDLLMSAANPRFKAVSTGVSAGNNAGISMKTGYASSVWQVITKADTLVIGIESVADFMTFSNAGDVTHSGHFSIATGKEYRVNAVKVLGGRITGWAAATGTATRTTFATGSVTLPQLAERVKALLDDLTTHGMIGA